jgi:hypothetical protein
MIKLLENFWLKIIALLMGLFIWFHVATEKTYNYELKLPVVQVDLKDSLTLAVNPPDSLLVKVSARGKQLLRRQWRDEGLRINATRYVTGRHRVTLSPSNTFLGAASSDITLDEIIFPSQVELSIDQLSDTTLPVTPDITLKPDDGFVVDLPIRTDPTEVTLHGPRSLLDRFSTVFSEQVDLADLRNDVTLTLPLVTPPFYGMKLEPDSVTLTVSVVPVKTKVFEDLPIVVYNVPPGYTAATEPATTTLELTGSPDEIDMLDRSAVTVSADFRETNELGMAPVKIDFPSSFRLRKSSTGTVKVTLVDNADTRD